MDESGKLKDSLTSKNSKLAELFNSAEKLLFVSL